MNLALLAAAATGVQIGATIVASRAVIGEVPPLTLALLRYAIALLCLAPWILKAFRPQKHTKQRPPPSTSRRPMCWRLAPWALVSLPF